MRIKNNLKYEVHFSYAGVRAGRSIKAGEIGPVIPVSRMQDRTLRRDFMRGYIDIILDEGEEGYVGATVAEGLKKPAGSRTVFPDNISAQPQPTAGNLPNQKDKYTVKVEKEEETSTDKPVVTTGDIPEEPVTDDEPETDAKADPDTTEDSSEDTDTESDTTEDSPEATDTESDTTEASDTTDSSSENTGTESDKPDEPDTDSAGGSDVTATGVAAKETKPKKTRTRRRKSSKTSKTKQKKEASTSDSGVPGSLDELNK